MNACQVCSAPTNNLKFCSRSCSGKAAPRVQQTQRSKVCLECAQEFDATGKTNGVKIYCSRSCSATANNRKYPKRGPSLVALKASNRAPRTKEPCANCGETVVNAGKKFCSFDCNTQYKRAKYIANWLANGIQNNSAFPEGHSIREYIRDEQEGCCAICLGQPVHNGMELRLILDHISGDASDNSRQNLRLVCPNCDSQLDTYKAKNKGQGRHWRKQRFAEGKSF